MESLLLRLRRELKNTSEQCDNIRVTITIHKRSLVEMEGNVKDLKIAIDALENAESLIDIG